MAVTEARESRGGAATAATHAVVSASSSWVRNWASQDWFAVGYFVLLLTAICLGKGPHREDCFVSVAARFGVFLFVLALVRVPVLRWGGAASSLLYRSAIIATLLSTFFQLRYILAAVSPWSDDAELYAIDMRVFHFEPSLWLDRYVSHNVTEWFAFFYFLYFIILCIHVLPMMFLNRDTNLLNRFATGALLMFLSSHIFYMLVPGYGPYWYLEGSFQHQLVGGDFWRLVRETVAVGGAQKDIFPSLHTASPTFFAIFSFRHRKLFPFKYWWPVIAFLATQIIIATMFLRWHYLIDVIAGLVFAATCQFIGQYVADWERAKRERLGLQPVWMPLVYPWSRASD